MWQIEKSTRQLMIHLEKVNPIPWAVLIVAPGPHLLSLSLPPPPSLSLSLALCFCVSVSVTLCVCVYVCFSLSCLLSLSLSLCGRQVGRCGSGELLSASALLRAVLLVTLPHA
jgi:hypothetical protein